MTSTTVTSTIAISMTVTSTTVTSTVEMPGARAFGRSDGKPHPPADALPLSLSNEMILLQELIYHVSDCGYCN